MSDGPTHFKDETIRLLTKGLHVLHRSTIPYCPWSNGAVERLGKEVLRAARSLLSVLQLQPNAWLSVLPLIQSTINNTPSAHRLSLASATIFTARPASSAVNTFLQVDTTIPVSLSEFQLESLKDSDELLQAMESLHPHVDTALTHHRRRDRGTLSKGELPKFAEGYFVLMPRDNFTTGEKLCLQWRGPRCITKALSDYAYLVEDMRTRKSAEVHRTRPKFNRDASLDTRVITSHVLASVTGMQVSRIVRFVEKSNKILVAIRWRGLDKSKDTQELLEQVYENVPKLLSKLVNCKPNPCPNKAKVRTMLDL